VSESNRETGREAYRSGRGVIGALFGFVKDEDRELARMIPSGYGYSYGPTAVHSYEIEHELAAPGPGAPALLPRERSP
jgi:hypothetical protein